MNLDGMIAVDEISGFDSNETELLRARFLEAREHLQKFRWFKGVTRLLFAGGFSQVAVFYAQVDSEGYDSELWVIVGDIPPAHLVVDDIANYKEALLTYTDHMQDWVEAAKTGGSVAGCIPVNAPPTAANAALLESRLKFINEKLALQSL